MKRFTAVFIIFILLCSIVTPVLGSSEVASDITDIVKITGDAVENNNILKNRKHESSQPVAENGSITVTSSEKMGYLYIKFQTAGGIYYLTDNNTGATVECGQNRFLHDLLDLGKIFGTSCTSVSLTFRNAGTSICCINVYTPGVLPDSVQKWEPPLDNNADIVLFCTHGDDDQLFFAGLMPYYAEELGYKFQVVYFTDHHNQVNFRVHEMLDGLWETGVTAYPVFGPFPDFRVDDIDLCYKRLATYGFGKEDVEAYVTEQIRRFKPLVAVGHDLKGESGHGEHKIYAAALTEAVNNSMNSSYYPSSAAGYGTWDVPKTYIHLYDQNEIVMDWDKPLKKFGGMTAFEVTRDLGFERHTSQLKTGYYNWIHGASTAKEIKSCNPCRYGLYRTSVGADTEKNDMFEHVMTYEQVAEAVNLAAETKAAAFEEYSAKKEALRLEKEEQERLRAELEEERLEEERLAAEAAAAKAAKEAEERRLAEEARAAAEEEKRFKEEAEALEAERLAAEAARKIHTEKRDILFCELIIGCALIIAALVVPFPGKRVRAVK